MNELEAILRSATESKDVAGAVVRVLRDGDVAYEGAFGKSDVEGDVPMRPDAVFRLASMTKPIVSMAALTMLDEGKLSLDDPVTRFLPDFMPKTKDGRTPVLTMRHLMTHTAGLTYGFLQPFGDTYEKTGISDGGDRPERDLEDNLRRIASVPLVNAPGEVWTYSVATDVLGAALQVAAGMSLPEVVAQRITGPLGMKDTVFVVDARLASRLAAPYQDGDTGIKRIAGPTQVPFAFSALRLDPARALSPTAFPSAGAGMVGTAQDYAVFLEELRTGGRGILKPETRQLLLTSQTGDKLIDVAGLGYGYSLGVAVRTAPPDADSPLPIGAFEWGGIWGTKFWVDPSRNLTVVLNTNTTPAGVAGPLANAVRDAIFR